MIKKKLALLIGEPSDQWFINHFIELLPHFSITILSFKRDSFLNHIPDGFKYTILSEEVEFSGAALDLEQILSNFDLVFSFEIHSFCTLQACHITKNLCIPLVIYSTLQDKTYFSSCKNIELTMLKITQMGNTFMCPNQEAKDCLIEWGVAEEKISIQKPDQAKNICATSSQRREKFRKYFSLPQEDFIFLLSDKSQNLSEIERFLFALSFLKREKKISNFKTKVIVTCSEQNKNTIKLLAANSKIGSETFIISQNTEPYFYDLLCACDVLVAQTEQKSNFLPVFPYHAVDLPLLKTILLSTPQSQYAKLADPQHTILYDNDENSMASAIINCLKFKKTKDLRANNISTLGHFLLHCILHEDFIDDDSFRYLNTLTSNELLPHIEKLRKQLNVATLAPKNRGNILRLLAKQHEDKNNFDLAIENYEMSLKEDKNNKESLIALGNLHYKLDENEQALKFYRRAYAQDAQSLESILGLAQVYLKVDLAYDALPWLEKALTLEGESKTALLTYAHCMLKLSDKDFAMAKIRLQSETIKNKGVLMQTLATLLARSGRNVEASMLLEEFF